MRHRMASRRTHVLQVGATQHKNMCKLIYGMSRMIRLPVRGVLSFGLAIPTGNSLANTCAARLCPEWVLAIVHGVAC